ncbi:site-2 protease family protein [Nocardioides sp. zg-536]|uniref:Site-2 protease family protein n=1 Tax=Nocardioides faecalis TaxID=2803858 RepID=A0A938Y338_9ACTN|nr:site-2 protease family protein [Nocardioides faecalis]MBM9461312.1 site-2 protease family protein [Nocardioides faecalis]MBS4752382.1 site-2 protease family protein [Nocardioides faecalis]QVI57677.1 site-2 protease family protein [Nocardioides faecalis]
MTALLYILGVVVFVVAILASIGLHELGHMIPAKAFGGKVTQYFIGFGPTVWSKQVGETEYGVKAIPLGGYVKIVGMLPPAALEAADEVTVDSAGNQVVRVRKSNTGMFTQLISDARAAEWELVGPEDSDRLFYKLPWWKKVIVMAGGPSVNILIAFGIFAAVFATYGNAADPAVDTTIAEVQACVIPAEEDGRPCTAEELVESPAPAYRAGIEVGDRVVSFNGTEVSSWDQVQRLVRANGSGPATVVLERDGQLVTVTTNTTVTPRFLESGDTETQEVGFLGVRPSTRPTTGGVGYTVTQMGDMTVEVGKALVTLPAKVWGVAKAIVGVEERDPQGPVSIVGGGRLAGETASHDEIPVKEKTVSLLMLIAGFNFFIGMFNFVPLLPLDGGHIASALWEGLRRGRARLLRRPDPGYVDAAKLLPVAYVVASALLVMGVVLIVGDLVVPLSLES